MNSNILHNISGTPFNERETFNNAILLLSMVRSEYYYIVGFSRPDNKVEVGFDFCDDTYGQITENIMVDFSCCAKSIRVSCHLSNLFFEKADQMPSECSECFRDENGFILYERYFERDKLIPVSMEKLNSIILCVKDEIGTFLKTGFENIIYSNK